MKKYSLRTRLLGFIKEWFYAIYMVFATIFGILACVPLALALVKERSSKVLQILCYSLYYILAWFIVMLPWWHVDSINEAVEKLYERSKAKDHKKIQVIDPDEEE